jgi:hypothetical protein
MNKRLDLNKNRLKNLRLGPKNNLLAERIKFYKNSITLVLTNIL